MISRSFDSVDQVLTDAPIPKYLGISHLSRSEAIDHNILYSNEFFGKKVITIWDGKYFYTGKAGSHELQRSTYSGRTKSHLVKSMTLCSADSYCLDTWGPSIWTANDTTITNHITTTKNAIEGWCEAGDVITVDRGFRNAAEAFSHLGYESKMPIYLRKGQKQHTTKGDNGAWLVTKIQWTVESYHGRLKNWRFFF